ncbi:MAG: dihydroorotase family protein [Planctomycetota bacterium]|nr:dihydroorotase family protein [Planctomycetota bacterium]
MNPSSLLFTRARVFDGQRFHEGLDVLVQNGLIHAMGPDLSADGAEVVDGSGQWLIPGLVDCHVHFREPGLVRKEGYATGSAGALHGGVTTVLEIQNNPPLMNTAALLQEKCRNLEGVSLVDFAPYGSLTEESADHLADLAPLCKAVKCFLGCSTGAGGVKDLPTLRRLFSAAAAANVKVVAHCEDNQVMDQAAAVLKGEEAVRHDLQRSVNAEVQSVKDAIQIAGEVGADLHVFHISTGEGAQLVVDAAASGQCVTGTTAPHYLLMTAEEAHMKEENRFKVNPSIKYQGDQDTLLGLLEEGLLQGVGTDHAPHPLEEKARPYAKAPAGFPSVDLLLPLMLEASDRSPLSVEQALASVTSVPAQEFGLLHKGRLAVGADADLVLLDPQATRVVEEASLLSKSGWSPYQGRSLRGFPERVWLRGFLVFADGKVVGPARGQWVGSAKVTSD